MAPTSYLIRARYHWRWAVKYSAASVMCFGLSLVAWATYAGLVALVAGYTFAALARRERMRAHLVLP